VALLVVPSFRASVSAGAHVLRQGRRSRHPHVPVRVRGRPRDEARQIPASGGQAPGPVTGGELDAGASGPDSERTRGARAPRPAALPEPEGHREATRDQQVSSSGAPTERIPKAGRRSRPVTHEDGHRLLPRWRRGAQRQELLRKQQRAVTKIVKETGRPISEAKPSSEAGGDPLQLRGIPAIGRGAAGGAIAGTRPDVAAEKLDDRGGRR
jgi:hypothetical protein